LILSLFIASEKKTLCPVGRSKNREGITSLRPPWRDRRLTGQLLTSRVEPVRSSVRNGVMIRALFLLAAAVALAFLPVAVMIRVVLVSITLTLALVVGWFAYVQEGQREREAMELAAREEALWQAAPPGLVRVVGWSPLAPLPFPGHWVVDGVVSIQSEASPEMTGVEITVEAFDCPSPDSSVGDCLSLGRSTSRASFLPLPADITRRVRLRFEFADAPFPGANLRLLPSVTALRR
jgi:hypothetical protein